jgi:predicted nucleotidyltransferase
MTKRKLQHSIKQVLDQIVSLANPTRVILFGSAAKGNITPDSDLDFLVVVPNSRNREDVVDCLNKGVRQKAMPCDFLVVTAAALRRTKANAGLIYGEILKTGREIYAA